ncbi:MAG TPA: proton-conducting transporter membrane subunit, partial [Armatimonadota bacterium]|nr:proton-conducting transporter membrane subunit [Armatimonadota bacterium]
MTLSSLAPLAPLVIVALSSVLIMLTLAFRRNHALTASLTLVGLGLAIAALFVMPSDSFQVTSLMVVDGYARFFTGLLLSASFAVVLFSHGYLTRRSDSPEEFYLLILLATLGAAVLVASSHFASFFLGLEILSVSLYALIAYLRPEARGVEAAVKYLVLAAASSGFLLFGIALVYAETGTMEFARITSVSPLGSNVQNLVLLSGMAMIIV